MRLLLRNGTANLVHADAGGAVLAMALATAKNSVALGSLGGGEARVGATLSGGARIGAPCSA